MINLKNLESHLLKIGKKNITKALIFTILDTLQLKKLVIVLYSVFSITCLLIMKVDILKKNGNKYLIFDDSTNEKKGL